MSFLARYWQAVERQHLDTGMNYGDIRIDLSELDEKNTVVDNVVDPSIATEPQPTIHPQQDGVMPRQTEAIDRKFERASRGSARPDQRFQEMAEDQRPQRESKRVRGISEKAERPRGMGSVHNKTKETARSVDKHNKKLLKKLGAGRRVRVQLDKVVINGEQFKCTTTHT